MAFEVILNRPHLYRVLLEDRHEGVYINVFESPAANEPFIDRLAPHLEGAKLGCLEEFGIQEDQWIEVPNEPWHAPG